jgi:predicted ArsR family transcriptional regulator
MVRAVGTSDLAERRTPHEALAVASRRRLLDVLRSRTTALDAAELAAATGLHVSTVRFHLDVLAEAGLVRHRAEPTGGRGRPRLLYEPARAGEAPEHTGYQLLASLLAAYWGGTPAERSRRAEHAGRAAATAQHLAPAPTVDDALAEVVALFAELGFEPDLTRNGDEASIGLHACPFRAVATEHPEVVCAMHLGMLRGALADLGVPATPSSLTPFVEPHLCVARITAAPHPGQHDETES